MLLATLAGVEGIDASLDVFHPHPVVGNRDSEQLLLKGGTVVVTVVVVARPAVSFWAS
jgi:hypothetical protein